MASTVPPSIMMTKSEVPAFAVGLEGRSLIVRPRALCSYLSLSLLLIGDSADDIHNVDLTKVHNLSGPIDIEGAKPGDILVGEILSVTRTMNFAHALFSILTSPL